MEVEQEADVSRAAFRPMSELVVRLPQGRDFPRAAAAEPDQVAAAMPGLGCSALAATHKLSLANRILKTGGKNSKKD